MLQELYRTCCNQRDRVKADKNKENYKETYMIPPALPKVWKPVSEGDFDKFEGATDYPCDLCVSDDHHFEPPAR